MQENNTNEKEMQPVQPEVKVEKKKKKKKHRFLKFLLVVVLIILVCKGLKWGADVLTEKELSSLISQYPLEFTADYNNMYYVTEDFRVEAVEGVEWKSENTDVLDLMEDGTVKVNRPTSSGKEVTLTVTRKSWIIGKAQKSYNLYVIGTETQTPESFQVVTTESVINNQYKREMTLSMDETGNVVTMTGDFNNTYIYSAEDGLALIEAYKEELNLDERVDFKFWQIRGSDVIKTYYYIGNIDGIDYGEYCIILNVNAATNELERISSEFDREVGISDTSNIREDLDFWAIIGSYMKENAISDKDFLLVTEGREIIAVDEVEYVVEKVLCITEEDDIYIFYVDLGTGNVVKWENGIIDGFKWSEKDTGKGENELGETVTFPIEDIGSVDIIYLMQDTDRNITVYNQMGHYFYSDLADLYEETEDIIIGINVLIEYYISQLDQYAVVSVGKEFDDEIACGSYANLIEVYDWYEAELGLRSYDGNGSELDLIVNSNLNRDNASWNSEFKEIAVGTYSEFGRSLGANLDILGHEYTHAVFGDLTSNITSDNDSVAAMNEAYADIFGCLISGSMDWKIGETILADGTYTIVRDIANYNNPNLYNTQKTGLLFPTKWHGENWSDEEHVGSVLISHIAWQMYDDPDFTSEDIKNIWYQSLLLGYGNDSDFVTCRKNVLTAMDNLNYSKELQDKVASWFDAEDILDDEYVYQTEGMAVEGDPMLDNTEINDYYAIMSPIGSVLVGTPIYLYEITDDRDKEEEAYINQEVNAAFTVYMEGMTALNGEPLTIEFQQIPSWKANILKVFVSDSQGTLGGIMKDSLGESEESAGIIDFLIKLSIIGLEEKATAYDFYDELGYVDYMSTKEE